MNYDDFFREASVRDIRPPENNLRTTFNSSLDNEALFQLPLLAMVILTLAKGRSKPKLSELGQIVGECLERTVSGFRGSSQDIGWSANLRIRTIKALTFLERAGLALVDPADSTVIATEIGRKIAGEASNRETPLSSSLLIIERSFENIRAERRIRAEVK
ncbi:hypothetical protein [Stenotrophomonas acidaminiphila]|uniref:hypothetical protein n=1 Tax=Stenotrophomonas acidaminiphila TaxID=128780 RepID=UPI0028A7F687|nr:hypothetical protein [Stenotrophomonas acidaminiphila]